MKFIKFLHKLFKPNCDCEICSAPRCELCIERQNLIDQERFEIKKLIDQIIQLSNPNLNKLNLVETNQEEYKPIQNKFGKTWNVLRNELETNDRERARILKEQNEAARVSLNSVKTKTEEEIEMDLTEVQHEDGNEPIETKSNENQIA